jgi:SAM-dependent methyltransferase
MGEASWWQSFYDREYIRLWGGALNATRDDVEAAGLWDLLELAPGKRVLDAPCGYGRLARRLAERGAVVVGVDQAADQLERAEMDRGAIGVEALRYVRRDLRLPLGEEGFDAAFNVFSSIGHGTEEDDLAVLRSIRHGLAAGGLFVLETMHRDLVVARFSRGLGSGERLEDGTVLVEQPVLDAITGRVETVWHYAGPVGAGSKRASLRVYTATELVRLLEKAGFAFKGAFAGLTRQPFKADGPHMGGRIALLAARV